MRKILILFVVLLAACTATEKEVLTTSVDVDQKNVPALLAAIDKLTDNVLDVDGMLELAESTPMDEELQQRYAVKFSGSDEEILLHVWREQVEWVHLYFSSTSKELIDVIEKTNSAYARESEN